MTQFQEGCGGLAEECLLSSELAFDIPEGMSSEEAAGFWIPYWTAWFGLVVRGRVSANDTVLVLGATGSSGTAAVQLAKAIGAARVIAVAGGEQKCRFCQELGADAVIDHQKQDITAATRVLTGGRGVDVVYDPVGGEPGRAAFLATAFEGRFVLIGFAAGDWPRIDLLETLFPNISLLGSTPSLEFGPEVHRDAYERLACFWQQGRLKHSASHVFDFSEGRGAIEHIAARRVQGKVVVRVR
jgi:NADPH2:quinone reductase